MHKLYLNNLLLLTDSYKLSHWKQYPKGTTVVSSYLESRGGKFKSTVFYGLQYFIKEYLCGQVVTLKKIEQAKKFVALHIGPDIFNEEGWLYIYNTYGGKLPIEILAVPEGTVVSVKNVMACIKNTDPNVPWLTNWLETVLLQVWYPTTVATLSREIKKKIIKYLKLTTDYNNQKLNEIADFCLQDFGFRGASSPESAGIGGSAHIINFKGSDTIPAILFAQEYYNAGDEMLAYSVPASEHSTITSWTEDFELKAFENMLDKYPTGTIACVSDSYNIIRACELYWGTILKQKILSREGVLVIRPDSGDPVQTLRRLFNILWDKFGGVVNTKGYKVLDPHVRILQGDGINFESIGEILDMMVSEKFSTENIIFGMGGALLQKVDRDTQNFAFKCSYIVANDITVDVRKNPIEINKDGEFVQSFKKSKAGHLKLLKIKESLLKDEDDSYVTIEQSTDDVDNIMRPVFRNGELLIDMSFDEIRNNAKINIDLIW